MQKTREIVGFFFPFRGDSSGFCQAQNPEESVVRLRTPDPVEVSARIVRPPSGVLGFFFFEKSSKFFFFVENYFHPKAYAFFFFEYGIPESLGFSVLPSVYFFLYRVAGVEKKLFSLNRSKLLTTLCYHP
jgi:hypothetical protein